MGYASKTFASIRRAVTPVIKGPIILAKASYQKLRSVDGIDETAYALSQTAPGLLGPVSGAAVFLGGMLPVGAGAAGSIAEYREAVAETDRLATERKAAEMLAHSANDALSQAVHGTDANPTQKRGTLLTDAGHQWHDSEPAKKTELIGLMNNAALKLVDKEELTAQHKEMRTRKRSHWTGPVAMVGMTAGMIPGAVDYVMQSSAIANHLAVPVAAETAGTVASSLFLGSQVFMTAYGVARAAQGIHQLERLNDSLTVVQGPVGQSLRSAHPEDEALQQGMTLVEEDLHRKMTYASALGTEYGTATAAGQMCMAAGTIAAFGGVTMPLGAAMFIPGMALTVGAAASRACWESAEKRYLGQDSEAVENAPAAEESKAPEQLAGEAAKEASRSADSIIQAKTYSVWVKADRHAGRKLDDVAATTPAQKEALTKALKRETQTLTPRTRASICLPFIGRHTTLLPSMRENVRKEVKVTERPAYSDMIRQMTGAAESESAAHAALQYARQAEALGAKRWREAFREEFGRKTRGSHAYRHAMNAVNADSDEKKGEAAVEAFLQSSDDVRRYRTERAMTQAAARIAKDQAKAAFQTSMGKLTSALKAERMVRLAVPISR